jgi:hypothetical protein
MKSLLMCLIFLLSLPAWANKTGLGISIGNPIGLNGKYWLDDDKAVDAGAGFSFGKHTDFSIHSDFLLHNKGALFVNDVNPLDLYYGIGGRMEFADDIEVGIRVPVGLAFVSEGGQSDIFAEVAPIIDIVSKTGLELHWLFGARYYF